MSTIEIESIALRLPPAERFDLIETLLKSLDQPDPAIDRVWSEEAQRRLTAIDEGRLDVVSLDEALGQS